MNIYLACILLIVGLLLLWKTGGWSVTNAIRFSNIYRIESFLVGFFLFAISTSLPEITSAVVSSLKNVPTLSGGNLLGSTLNNLTLLLGISTLVAGTLKIDAQIRKKLSITTPFVLGILALIVFIPLNQFILGMVLVGLYIISFIFFRNGEKKDFSKEVTTEHSHEKIWITNTKIDVLLKLSISLGTLIFSSWLTVLSAVHIAKDLHIPLDMIGTTIIALGTCLPELTLEIHAIKKKEYALALGDIFGSSLVNISFILGLLMLMNPPFDLSIAKPVFFFLLPASILIFYHLLTQKPFKTIDGIFFILLFIAHFLKVSFSIL